MNNIQTDVMTWFHDQEHNKNPSKTTRLQLHQNKIYITNVYTVSENCAFLL